MRSAFYSTQNISQFTTKIISSILNLNSDSGIPVYLYSMQDTKTPMINAAIGMALNIILNITLSKYIGISGLALATSIAAVFTTILLFISLRKKIGPFGMKKIAISFLKILFGRR